MSNALVKLLGFPATLIHGDTLVWDRWRWLKRRLPKSTWNKKLLDVGCGSGAFTIGAARRGYHATGLSYDERNQQVAAERAELCGAFAADFETLDVRGMDQAEHLMERFDLAICLEVIEHILDDQKVFHDIHAALKPGGKLLLTAPFHGYKAIIPSDDGPFCETETGWHVRRGYWEEDLRRLATHAGFEVEEVSYLSGFFSQKVTGILWRLQNRSKLAAWASILPLRVLPPLLDQALAQTTGWPGYSIGLVARKKA